VRRRPTSITRPRRHLTPRPSRPDNDQWAAGAHELPDPPDQDFVGAALRLVHLKLDEIDLRIVALLRQDGRMATREIARRCGVAEGRVRRRVSRLVDEGIIRVTVLTDPPSVGLLLSALLLIKCRMELMEEISRELARQPEVRYVAVVTGAYDLIVEAFFYSRRHLTTFLTKRVATMEGITDTTTSVVLEVAKLSYEWEIPSPAEH
jgi:Lrp/AsnC family transcriptional regulator, regulator for asnA, asnC and gidA